MNRRRSDVCWTPSFVPPFSRRSSGADGAGAWEWAAAAEGWVGWLTPVFYFLRSRSDAVELVEALQARAAVRGRVAVRRQRQASVPRRGGPDVVPFLIVDHAFEIGLLGAALGARRARGRRRRLLAELGEPETALLALLRAARRVPVAGLPRGERLLPVAVLVVHDAVQVELLRAVQDVGSRPRRGGEGRGERGEKREDGAGHCSIDPGVDIFSRATMQSTREEESGADIATHRSHSRRADS